MMVADVLAPNRCQAISNHHADSIMTDSEPHVIRDTQGIGKYALITYVIHVSPQIAVYALYITSDLKRDTVDTASRNGTMIESSILFRP